MKEVRKSLNLTLEKFGGKLGVGKTAISKIEKGENNLTEANIRAICREFNVDYIWLTTGEGEMFVESDDDFLEKIDRIMANEEDFRKKLFKALINASEEDILSLEKWIDFCADLKKGE